MAFAWRHYRVEVAVLEKGVHIEFFNKTNTTTWYADVAAGEVGKFTGYMVATTEHVLTWLKDILEDSHHNAGLTESGTGATFEFTVASKLCQSIPIVEAARKCQSR